MNGGSVSQGWPGMTHDSVSDGSLSQRLAPLQRGTNPSQIETLQFTSRGLHHHPPDTGAKVWRTFIFGSWNRKRERLRSFSKLSIFGLSLNNWFDTVIQLSEIRKSSLSNILSHFSLSRAACFLFTPLASSGIIFCSCLRCQVFLRPSSINNNSLYPQHFMSWWWSIGSWYFVVIQNISFHAHSISYTRNSRIKSHELILIGKIAVILKHTFTFLNMIEDIRILNMAVAISESGCNKFTSSSWYFWSISPSISNSAESRYLVILARHYSNYGRHWVLPGWWSNIVICPHISSPALARDSIHYK